MLSCFFHSKCCSDVIGIVETVSKFQLGLRVWTKSFFLLPQHDANTTVLDSGTSLGLKASLWLLLSFKPKKLIFAWRCPFGARIFFHSLHPGDVKLPSQGHGCSSSLEPWCFMCCSWTSQLMFFWGSQFGLLPDLKKKLWNSQIAFSPQVQMFALITL